VNKSGLILKLWKPEKRTPHSSGLYDEIPITVNLIGGYHNLGVFLDRVAKLPRIVNVQNIRMDSAKKDVSGAINININCTALTFAATEKKVEATTSKSPATK
jgi:type IV pilus assembly protein PilO